MILLQTNRLAVVLALALAGLTGPLVLGLGGLEAFWPGVWQPALVPIVAVVEFGLFVLLLSAQRQIRSVVPVVVAAACVVLARLAAVAAGALAVASLGAGAAGIGLDSLIVNFWMGSPLAIVLQIAALVAALPAGLHAWAPGFLDRSALERLNSWGGPEGMRRPIAAPQVIDAVEMRLEVPSAPHARPFVYSFAELSQSLDRIVGLEGHLVLNGEGLVVSGRVPFQQNREELAGHLARWQVAAIPLLAPGARVPRHAMLHSADHWIVTVALAEESILTLFFTERLTESQVAQAATRAAEAAHSLFAYRYGEGAHTTAAPRAAGAAAR